MKRLSISVVMVSANENTMMYNWYPLDLQQFTKSDNIMSWWGFGEQLTHVYIAGININ